jgi:hypothetical protein
MTASPESNFANAGEDRPHTRTHPLEDKEGTSIFRRWKYAGTPQLLAMSLPIVPC